jgi:sugar (pentulose or hexulose) kinase
MNGQRHIAVIDIGKTNAKLALVDLDSLTEIAVVTRPNTVRAGPPWPHFDTEGHWAFLLNGLGKFHLKHRVDAISITTHGASIALLEENGSLAAPILDYEHDGPSSVERDYDAIRPPFSETGSPRLANGLNVGAQLHWQFLADPTLHARTAKIVTYPQYWGHRLTGVAATDVTSIGCHTDLWSPNEGKFSALVEALNISDKIAPARKSGDILGTILPHITEKTGLSPDTPVACGIHDSNASLYPHILTQQRPFSVVSTGTWVIAMSVSDSPNTALDPNRDMLFNVNALGQAVPSARFMGGREFELIQRGHPVEITDANVNDVLHDQLMLMPSVVPETGPFQGMTMRWTNAEPTEGSGTRSTALSFYLALMTETCLRLTQAEGPTIVEGPFAKNEQYMSMLAAATGRPVCQSQSATGTSIGAALLFSEGTGLHRPIEVDPPRNIERFSGYAEKWRQRVALKR